MSNNSNHDNKDSYAGVLGRGGPAEWRLTFQHYVTTQHQGYVIHPKIIVALSNRKDLRIADLGTGNGIWALDVAERYPKAQVLGTDISDKQFPRNTSQLANTKFAVQNMFDEIPEQYREAFDIVHLRLTVGWIIKQDKDLLVRNILSMVKPGGFLQWSEVSSPPLWIFEPDGSAKPGLPSAWHRVLSCSGMLPGFEWLSHLVEHLQSHGMVEVESFRPKPSGSNMQAQQQCLAWTSQEIFETLIHVGVPGAEEQRNSALQEMDQEYSEGRQFAYHWQTVIARKPT